MDLAVWVSNIYPLECLSLVVPGAMTAVADYVDDNYQKVRVGVGEVRQERPVRIVGLLPFFEEYPPWYQSSPQYLWLDVRLGRRN